LHDLVIRLVKLSETWIWRHHCQELVDLGDPGMLLEEGHYTVLQSLKHTEILNGIKDMRYDNSNWRDAFHIPEDAF
jgi:hypothetical protein